MIYLIGYIEYTDKVQYTYARDGVLFVNCGNRKRNMIPDKNLQP